MYRPTFFIMLASLVVGVGGACAEEGLRAGANAPDFSLPTVKKQVVTLKDAVAKGTVILHFWKSKWRECQAEFPPLKKIAEEYKGVRILSINPIDMAGRVESDAGSYDLPYEVLVGRDSDIIDKYQIVKLPRLIIIAQGGAISFTERYVPYDKLKEEVIKAEAKKPKPAQEVAKTKTQKPKSTAKTATEKGVKSKPK